ncbi:MAG: PKD domain-containing protein, partial [Solirubrobacteraceae bacterium]|nr:PKD domain-containing protein [Solirubrobacteraceae bacterium]
PRVAVDAAGNATAVWFRSDGTHSRVQAAGYDAVGPTLSNVEVPSTGTAGSPVSVSASATDVWSAVGSIVWSFGDGTTATGAQATHTYAAGSYTVTVSATDAFGTTSTATRAITVSPAGALVQLPPVLPKLSATAKLTWKRLSSGATRLTSLRVNRAETGSTVTLTCTGKGCRKAASRRIVLTTKNVKRKSITLTRYISGMTLRPGSALSIGVSRPGYQSRTFRYTMVKRRSPKKTTTCLTPGAANAVSC